MQHTSRKAFGPIRDAYAFFQRHTTETEADIRAYLPHLLAATMGEQPIRMLDFGCGDGAFTAALLDHASWLPARLQLALVEPDDVYRQQAVARLQAYTTQPWKDGGIAAGCGEPEEELGACRHGTSMPPSVTGRFVTRRHTGTEGS